MMATWLEEHGVELVVLAGYMHLLTKPFLDRFPDRIVNVHSVARCRSSPARIRSRTCSPPASTETGVTVHSSTRASTPGRCSPQRASRSTRRHRETLLERIQRSSTGCCPRW